MAQRTKTVVVCDMHRDEAEARGTVEFVVNDRRTRLDLCPEHLDELLQQLRPWLRAGQPVAGTSARRASRGTAGEARRTAAAVRAWAAANGYDLPARGRIPGAVHEAYRAANGSRA